MNFSKFETLNKEQSTALCTLAYALSEQNFYQLLQWYPKYQQRNYGPVRDVLKQLENLGLVESPKSNGSQFDPTYRVRDEWTVKVWCYMLREKGDLLGVFEKRTGQGDMKNMRTVMGNVLSEAMNGRKPLTPMLQFTSKYAPLFAAVFEDPEWEDLSSHLSIVLFEYSLIDMGKGMFMNDDPDFVAKLTEKQKQISGVSSDWHKFRDDLQMANFLSFGTLSSSLPSTMSKPYAVIADAIDKMRNGDFGAAVEAFVSSGIFSDLQRQQMKYSFYPFFGLLYVLSLAKTGDTARLSEFCKSAQYEVHLVPARSLAITALPSAREVTLQDLFVNEIVNREKLTVGNKFRFMLAAWLGFSDAQIASAVRGCPSKKMVEPLSFALRLANDVLRSIPVKQQWERAIARIMDEEEKRNGVSSGASVQVEDRQERFAYFLNPNSTRVEVRAQKRLKSGRWSSGTHVNAHTMTYSSKATMDEIDKNIRSRIKYQDSCDIRAVLPLLEGTDKLYVGQSAPYANCAVLEEKPFLLTEIGKKEIRLSSNVPMEQLGNTDEDSLLYVIRLDNARRKVNRTMANGLDFDGEVAYFRVTVRVRNYMRILLEVGSFPLEAETQMRQLLDRIKGLVEIHSDMIEGGSNLPQIDGNPQVIVQIVRQRDEYDVRAIVRPMPEGRLSVVPGKGDTNMFDQSSDGKRYHIVRNKKLEKNNVAPLVEQMEQLDSEEVGDCEWRADAYTLLELLEWLPEQGDGYAVEWPEGEKISVRATDVKSWNVSIGKHGDWFEVEGEVPIDEKTVVSFAQLLEMLDAGRGRFIRIDDGQYLSLTDNLRRQLRRIESVAQNVRGKSRITSIGASLIGDALNGELTIEHPAEMDELRRRIKRSEELMADVPASLNATLRDYQEVGFRWIDRLASWGAGACLADDMGLGKTIQTITYLLHRQSEGASLVVAPASVVPNWKKELSRFAPTLRVVTLNDLANADRSNAIGQANKGCVVLTTYGLLISEEKAVTEKQWNVVCLDEAHCIKNASTKTSAVCMQMQAKSRLILTGTPVQNHLGELWNLFQFINPGLLGSLQQFTQKFINPIEGAHDKERQKQLKRIIQPFMLRRTKQEVVAELPDKQEITLPVELSKAEMAIYEAIRLDAKAQLEAEAGGSVSVNTLAMITRLRMAACAASLAQKKWEGSSAKIEAFCDLIAEITSSGNRALVFSQFTSFLEMIKAELTRRGISDFFYLDGTTPLQKRSKMVDDFQRGKGQFFIISLKAGGLGLNLTGANYVIHLDPWWNPAIEQQATDRAYRIGQDQKVTVYHLISAHTIEEKIVRLHQTKRDLADNLLEGADVSHKLRADDLLQMIDEGA
ncbi:MAG: DEAD/DEAH box helicase [Bacteroidales bacterium]|nr:DEAD/DEAH box helicase [Bacteroidales bacterium]